MPSAEERFRAKVEFGDDHDRWMGARDRRGGGMVRIAGKLRTVQRAAWEFAHGPLPDGARVNTCVGDRACVRIEHLSLVTRPGAATAPPAPHRRARGTGSVQELRPHVWRIVVTDPSLNGASRRRSLTVHGTRRDAEHARSRLVAATTRDHLGDLRVRELVARYLDWYGDPSDGPDRRVLHDILDPALGARLAAILTPLEIEAALRTAIGPDLPAAAARDALRLLRRSYTWAAGRGWCRDDPTEAITWRDLV